MGASEYSVVDGSHILCCTPNSRSLRDWHVFLHYSVEGYLFVIQVACDTTQELCSICYTIIE